ncbi:MAG: hypothetical protein IKL48_00925 [Elusimicrobiaceae bacterium]|nr:hypothetical protein [Elusimicrobiaceae bacterium]
MKKLSLLSVLFFSAVSVWAAGSNIKMVSYFPVPYVSYSDLKVSNTCDVGLGNSCTLNATSLKVQSTTTATANAALNTGTVLVKEGNLELYSPNTADSVLSGTALNVGNGSNTGNARLSVWGNLTVNGTFLNGNTVTNLISSNTATINSLQLQGGTEGASYLTFPTCDATDNKISWANLTIDGKNGVYLVCGEGILATPTPCVQSYGDQVENLKSDQLKDTCDEDTAHKFSCGFRGEERKCWDVYNAYNSPEDVFSPKADTCDGDIYIKSVDGNNGCVDYYFEWEGNKHESTNCDPESVPSNTLCMTKELTYNEDDMFDDLKSLGAKKFCEKYLKKPSSASNCTMNFWIVWTSTAAEGFCNRIKDNGKYLLGVTCHANFYKHTIRKVGRDVQCCKKDSPILK